MPQKCKPFLLTFIFCLAFVDDDYNKGKGSAKDREKLGLSNGKKVKSASSTPPPESMNAMQQVEVHFVYTQNSSSYSRL